MTVLTLSVYQPESNSFTIINHEAENVEQTMREVQLDFNLLCINLDEKTCIRNALEKYF